MRKITEESAEAFENLQPFKKGNTEVKILGTENGVPCWAALYLFGNKIAEIHKNKRVHYMVITNAGHKTNTTKERLNGLKNVSIKQVNGIWFLNSEQWDGKPKEIKL